MVKTDLSARVINGKKSKNIKISSLVEPAVLIMYWRENDRYFSFDYTKNQCILTREAIHLDGKIILSL